MKILARPRGTNKTHELLKIANDDNGIVLTTEKRALQVKADSYGFNNLTIIDLSDLYYNEFDSTKPLYIHKAADVFEDYFRQTFNMSLKGFSITMDNNITE